MKAIIILTFLGLTLLNAQAKTFEEMTLGSKAQAQVRRTGPSPDL